VRQLTLVVLLAGARRDNAAQDEASMRDQNPFGILPPWDKGKPLPIGNYLEINAKARLFGEGDVVLDEVPFSYDYKTSTFTPLSRSIEWEKVQEIAIIITVAYDITVPFEDNGSGLYAISQRWRVRYADKGIVLESGLLEDLGSAGSGKFAVAVDVKTDQPTAEAMLTSMTLLLKLVGGFTSEGITVGLVPVSVGSGGSAGVYSKTYKMKLGVLATGKPKPAIQLPDDLLKHTVWFDRENQPDLDAGELRRLEDKWVDPLLSRAPDLAATIKNGSCPVYLDGYASVTGRTDQYNLGLSVDRIYSVENALKSLFGSKEIKFVPQGHGRAEAKQRGPSPQEKRVEISIARYWAEQALKQLQG
jgi:hypothetical protein